MKAKRLFLAALLSVLGCVFAIAGCGDEESKAHDHEYDWEIVTAATCKDEGLRKGVCRICGEETTEAIPRTEHTLTGDITVLEPATCTKKGSGTQACSVCGSTQPVEIDMVPHTLEHHDEDPATCMKDGTIEYWHCTVCNNDFADAEGKTAVTTTVKLKEDVPHQYNEKGICSVCGARDPNAPHFCAPEKVDEVASDCKTPGVAEHYECPECGKLYRDEEATQEVQLSDLALPLSTDHKGDINAIYKKEVLSKDCATFGKKEHYDCKVCGRHFRTAELNEDEELIDVVNDEDVGENTLQTPKSLVHKEVKYRTKASATCSAIGWTEDCVECVFCGMVCKSKDFNEKTSMLKELVGTYKITIEGEDVNVPVGGKIYERDGKYYTMIGGSVTGVEKEVTIERNADGTPYVPAPLKKEDVTLDIDPQAHSPEPTKHVRVKNTGCGAKRVGFKTTCYECTYCGKIFEDQNYKTEAKLDEVYDYGAHGTMERSNATESTCVTHGHPECWTCKACGEHFKTQTPAADTAPLSDEEYNLPLAPHSFTGIKSNSKGHWRFCEAEGCGAYETDEDGETLIEEHTIEEDEDDTTCPVCGYGDINYIDYFEYSYDEDETYVILTGLKKDKDGKYFIEKSDETTLTLPEEDNLGIPVQEIAAYAFGGTMEIAQALLKITEIYVPNCITKIGEFAFGWTSDQTQFKVTSENIKKIEFERGANFVSFEGMGTFEWTFYEEIILPKNVSRFANYMFAYCSNLVKVVMPEKVDDKVAHTLTWTFNGCTQLKEIDLWCFDEVTFSLGSCAFWGDESLETLYIPKSITQLGAFSLSGCTSLTNIYFGGDSGEWTRIASVYGGVNAWNRNTANLQDDLEAKGILHCGWTPGA